MKIGYYSPMPPAATGVADYSAALVPHLRALGEVAVNAEGDIALYHAGNNGLHREIYIRAIARPGVVVIHDAVLQHLMLGMLDGDAYVNEFVYNYGEWSRDLAREMWRDRGRAGVDARYFSYPMLKRIATSALGVIVHNPGAAAIVRAHAPDATITEIPHLFEQPPQQDPVDIERLRRSLGAMPGTLLVGAFGHQRETKRIATLLRAFHRSVGEGANVRLVVSGQFTSSTFAQAMEPLLEHPNVVRLPFLSERDFWRYASAIDVCANLRYPSAGESSGVAVRLMGIGKAVLFTRDASIERIPEDACLRIDSGPAEEEMLAGYLTWLAMNRGAAAEIGRRAAAHIAREHDPARVAQLYWEAVRRAKAASSRSPSTSSEPGAPTGARSTGKA